MSAHEVRQNVNTHESCTLRGEVWFSCYRFVDGKRYKNQNRGLSELVWKGARTSRYKGEGFQLEPEQCLETITPAVLLTQAIRESNQFTLNTTVATAHSTQIGPARIVSLSQGPYYRNFTIGQEESSVVFRLRTPLTGNNGIGATLEAPEVLSNNRRHHLIITYDGSNLRLFVDGVQHPNSLHLSPGAVFLATF